jgi:hypothetical protein
MLERGLRSLRIPPPNTDSLLTTSSTVMSARSVPTASADRELKLLDIGRIRTDGGTQHRVRADPATVGLYAQLMCAGVVFPPITVWFDGEHYWLSDGFQRVGASNKVGKQQIYAEIRRGTQKDAQWDSYRANSEHGVRRTSAELRRVIHRALEHPNAATLSNAEIARHLNIPEATVRRWRKALSSSSDEDRIRVVTRGQSTYCIDISNIGKRSAKTPTKSRTALRRELSEMTEQASPAVRRVLIAIGRWVSGSGQSAECLVELESILRV